MNKRNKKLTSVLAAFLAVVMVLSMVPVSHAEAASTQKLTIYVGEEGTFIGYGNVRRVTSSKKIRCICQKGFQLSFYCKICSKEGGKGNSNREDCERNQKVYHHSKEVKIYHKNQVYETGLPSPFCKE